MSCTFDGSNRIVFSGTNGKTEFGQVWVTAQQFGGIQLPSPVGEKTEYFMYAGFLFVYRPML